MSDLAPPPTGRIDVHSHLIPGVDDGCQSLDESLESIAMLQAAGYTASICTPHVWPDLFPDNIPVNIARWTDDLRAELRQRGVDYAIYPGGELRLFDGVIDWMKAMGVPTLAGSRCVLCDFWEPRWPSWVDQAFDWLLAEGYQPILAHPERLSIPHILPEKLREVAARGVLLQGNFRCLTGEEGRLADQQIRTWLPQKCYDLLAMDMHRPDALPSRIEGMEIAQQWLGNAFVEKLTVDAPRKLIWDAA